MDVENPKEMKVLQLREELKSRGLSPSGLKSVLVRRLLQALKQEGHNTNFFMEEESPTHPEEFPTYHARWRKAKSIESLPTTRTTAPVTLLEDGKVLVVNHWDTQGKRVDVVVDFNKGTSACCIFSYSLRTACLATCYCCKPTQASWWLSQVHFHPGIC